MSDELSRIRNIASEILAGPQLQVISRGEGYYAFDWTDAAGHRSILPRVWIAPHAGDGEIREKLSDEFRRDFYPDSDPDDLSIPGLQAESK